jgi:hypothetical protein
VKVYMFGGRAPAQLDVVLRIQRQAGQYYNALIEIDRWRRIALHVGDLLGEDWRDEVAEERRRAIRGARAASGLSCGTYWLVEEAVARAASDTPRNELPRLRDNRSRPWTLIGACIPSANADKPHAPASSSNFSIVADGRYHVARLRVTGKSNGDETIDVPIKMHREIPHGTRIQRAALSIDRIGTRWIYSVIVTVDETAPSRVLGTGRCAVNLGWRRVPGGVRVALALGEDGRSRELVLPDRLLGRFRHAEGLRALADQIAADRFGDARRRTRLREDALRSHPQQGARLGLAPLHAASSLEHWARRDRHLYQWERDEYTKALRQRREIFRLWARGLAKEFGEIAIEDWSLAYFALRSTPCELPDARHYRFLVAPSYLRDELKSVFGPERVIETKGKFTVTCSVCGQESATAKKNRARQLVVECERCGARWDQDSNNAANQLAEVAAE